MNNPLMIFFLLLLFSCENSTHESNNKLLQSHISQFDYSFYNHSVAFINYYNDTILFDTTKIKKVYLFSHINYDADNTAVKKFTVFALTDSVAIRMADKDADVIQLNRMQVSEMITLFNDSKLKIKPYSNCFKPTQTLMLYGKYKEVLGFIQISFECSEIQITNYLSSEQKTFSLQGNSIKKFLLSVGVSPDKIN